MAASQEMSREARVDLIARIAHESNRIWCIAHDRLLADRLGHGAQLAAGHGICGALVPVLLVGRFA